MSEMQKGQPEWISQEVLDLDTPLPVELMGRPLVFTPANPEPKQARDGHYTGFFVVYVRPLNGDEQTVRRIEVFRTVLRNMVAIARRRYAFRLKTVERNGRKYIESYYEETDKL